MGYFINFLFDVGLGWIPIIAVFMLLAVIVYLYVIDIKLWLKERRERRERRKSQRMDLKKED